MRLFLKEIKNLFCFSRKTSEAEKTIIFYAEHGGYYPYFEGLIKELIDEHGQPICYITSDSNDPILRKSKPGLKIFYLKKVLPFFMAFIKCKIFVMTLTDLHQFYLKRSVNPVRYVYVFHALSSTMGYRTGAFDYYDVIFCVGPHQLNEIRKYEELHNLPPKRLIKAGYYRLERIYNEYQKYCSAKPASTGKYTVLIAPTWGTNILESYGEVMVKALLEAGYKVIVRPHPETIRRSPHVIDLLGSRFGEDGDFILERSVAGDDSLIRSDVMICDCYSGVALEYALGTERPVVFLDIPVDFKKRYFNPRYKELGIEPFEQRIRSKLGKTISPKELDKIPEIISGLISGREQYKKRIAEVRNQNIYAFGRSSEIGGQCIMNLAEGRDCAAFT